MLLFAELDLLPAGLILFLFIVGLFIAVTWIVLPFLLLNKLNTIIRLLGHITVITVPAPAPLNPPQPEHPAPAPEQVFPYPPHSRL